ncbi:MAG: GGDEF domain-containing protein [Alteromonadaceae bacterium]|nr:MAG: GGDEF domain-containing protein [Alteromonadaceae bacterium]
MKARIITLYDKLLLVLAIGSLFAVTLGPELLERTVTITPQTVKHIDIVSDESVGGNSVVRWVNKSTASWSCDIGSAYEYPFCLSQMYLNKTPTEGINLSSYPNVKIWLKYQGPANSMRLTLKNINPAYTNSFDLSTSKYNTLELDVNNLNLPVEVTLKDFRVAEWWLLQHEIPLEHSQSEFSNVNIIELQTGTGLHSDRHTFEFIKIQFEGQILSTEQLYFGIIILWVIAILIYISQRVILMSTEIKNREIIQLDLIAINSVLNIKSEQYKAEAKTDPLTGVKNRAGVRDALSDGYENSKNDNEPLTIILIDIDHFKAVNDTYGHDVGDEILKGLANVLQTNTRENDTLARWGGEEFLLVCANTNNKNALKVAEHIRKALEDAHFHNDMQITASFGLATLADESIDSLFKRADEALYQAKENGRNQVCEG